MGYDQYIVCLGAEFTSFFVVLTTPLGNILKILGRKLSVIIRETKLGAFFLVTIQALKVRFIYPRIQ